MSQETRRRVNEAVALASSQSGVSLVHHYGAHGKRLDIWVPGRRDSVVGSYPREQFVAGEWLETLLADVAKWKEEHS